MHRFLNKLLRYVKSLQVDNVETRQCKWFLKFNLDFNVNFAVPILQNIMLITLCLFQCANMSATRRARARYVPTPNIMSLHALDMRLRLLS